MVARVVDALSPRQRVGRRGVVDGLVGHLRRERRVEHVELRVAMMAPEGEAGIAIEAGMADDELLPLVLTPVVPDACVRVVPEEAAVGRVRPPTPADEIDP